MHAVHTTGDHTTSGVLGSYPLELLGLWVYPGIWSAGPEMVSGYYVDYGDMLTGDSVPLPHYTQGLGVYLHAGSGVCTT